MLIRNHPKNLSLSTFPVHDVLDQNNQTVLSIQKPQSQHNLINLGSLFYQSWES